MKKLLITTLLAIFCISLNAQTPNWAWADSPVGSYTDEGHRIATDASGNVYAVGYFYSKNITFGNYTLTNASPVNALGRDIYMVKYDPYGNVLWATSEGGIINETITGICIDNNGNIYLTGYYSSTSFSFGATTLNNVSDTNSSYLDDIFLVKYDASGNVIWAKTHGGNHIDESRGISIDTSGNIYITGYFGSVSIDFGTTTLTNTSTFIQKYDIFMVKYDPSGNVIWAKSTGGERDEYGENILIDLSGNIYTIGTFSSPSIICGTDTLINASALNIPPYTYNPTADVFIVKYNPMGNVIWAKSFGGLEHDYSYDIASDQSGNVYVTGASNSDSINFGTISLNNKYGNSYSSFIVKFDSVGNILWAKLIRGDTYDLAPSISVNDSNQLYVTGSFESDSIVFGTTILTKTGNYSYTSDIYIVKYDSSDSVLWAKLVGGIYSEFSNDISIDANENIYITGSFSSPSISFGATNLTNSAASINNTDMAIFVAKLGTNIGMAVETNSINTINIFPNPFSYTTTIKTNVFLTDASITVYNINGQVVKKITGISGNEITLYRDNLPDGIYLLHLTENNSVIVSEKFVIVD